MENEQKIQWDTVTHSGCSIKSVTKKVNGSDITIRHGEVFLKIQSLKQGFAVK